MRCGKPVKEDEQLYCYDCKRKDHQFDRGYSVFEYDSVKLGLYRFKYAGRAEYAAFYAQMTVKNYGETIRRMKADFLLPVPLHTSRMRKRGYNQAEEFARQISDRIQVPVRTDVIKRKRNTAALKTMDAAQRQNNLKNAFIITANDVKLKTIIVIDDIYTTGATMDAIAGLLKKAGAASVYVLTVAAGKGF